MTHQENTTHIVVWSEFDDKGVITDRYEALTPDDAEQRYIELLKLPNTYSANIAIVLHSTDYLPNPWVLRAKAFIAHVDALSNKDLNDINLEALRELRNNKP